jgi:heme-degrading monooxygenase HmoA
VHVQIVNFQLKDISEEDYRRQCEAIASAFANMPGLFSKTWLANQETNTYGGVYVWRDLQAMEDYIETDLYKGMLANPHFDNITVKDFAVLENPTRVTRGTSEVTV